MSLYTHCSARRGLFRGSRSENSSAQRRSGALSSLWREKLTCSPAMQSLPHFAASVFPPLLAAFLFLKYIISSRSGFILCFLFHFCLCCHLCLVTQSPFEVKSAAFFCKDDITEARCCAGRHVPSLPNRGSSDSLPHTCGHKYSRERQMWVHLPLKLVPKQMDYFFLN